jgi:hypothetical protein
MKLLELFSDPSGRLSEAKICSIGFKLAALWVLIMHTDKVLEDSLILLVLLLSGIAPDLLKKLISMIVQLRTGAKPT